MADEPTPANRPQKSPLPNSTFAERARAAKGVSKAENKAVLEVEDDEQKAEPDSKPAKKRKR